MQHHKYIVKRSSSISELSFQQMHPNDNMEIADRQSKSRSIIISMYMVLLSPIWRSAQHIISAKKALSACAFESGCRLHKDCFLCSFVFG